MFNTLATIYGHAAARNPGPYFLFAVVFFGLLGVPMVIGALTMPGPKKPTVAELDLLETETTAARKEAMAYCAEKKARPLTAVNWKKDGKSYVFVC